MDHYGVYHLTGATSPLAMGGAGQSPEWREYFLGTTHGMFEQSVAPIPWSSGSVMDIDQPMAAGPWSNNIAPDDQPVDPKLLAAFESESTPDASYDLPLTPVSPSPLDADASGSSTKSRSTWAPTATAQVKVKVEKPEPQSRKQSAASSSSKASRSSERRPETAKEEKLRKNREAASKSRVKKKAAEQTLERHAESMSEDNEELWRQYSAVKGELNELANAVLNHASACPDAERRARLVSGFESHRDRVAASGLGNLVRVSQSPNGTP